MHCAGKWDCGQKYVNYSFTFRWVDTIYSRSGGSVEIRHIHSQVVYAAEIQSCTCIAVILSTVLYLPNNA